MGKAACLFYFHHSFMNILQVAKLDTTENK